MMIGGSALNILWDFDGTLIDSYCVYVSNFKKVLGEDVPRHEIMAKLKVSIPYALSYYGVSDEEIESPSSYRPFAGAAQVLGQANRNVIVTHYPKEEVIRILTHYSLLNYFAEIIGPEDGFPKKPDDQAYRYLHEKYHIDLVIGDREVDLIPAKRLGIKTCMFQNLLEPGADFYVESYEQLSRILYLKEIRELSG
ncbi:HAD-IA family hydrolase [Ectobacillus antri]|jgi:HAD superfamily hydrolase (TIGR01549 family)|uniref:HAD-IA family hydrolase n=1 Tax=Ectobacillus antri TaxID=2486280 RepID=A0ABT6H8F2_9BACI|nr:HAD-IA family hydrolase [Ectobacillus antri]MDG4658114.1 HAD-IA family hydrolase [Ectobacillus antri]MDG5754940.1 HAD-IA family hydrolase [Ectobacillus antri]